MLTERRQALVHNALPYLRAVVWRLLPFLRAATGWRYEDLKQEANLMACEAALKWEGGDAQDNFSRWLGEVVKYRLLNLATRLERKGRGRHVRHLPLMENEDVEHRTGSEPLCLDDAWFTPQQAKVIRAVIEEGGKEQAAARLGCDRTTVRWHLAQAVKHARRTLGVAG